VRADCSDKCFSRYFIHLTCQNNESRELIYNESPRTYINIYSVLNALSNRKKKPCGETLTKEAGKQSEHQVT
jgi:hypothetical protein